MFYHEPTESETGSKYLARVEFISGLQHCQVVFHRDIVGDSVAGA